MYTIYKKHAHYVHRTGRRQLPGVPVVGAGIILERRVECDATLIEITERSVIGHLTPQLQQQQQPNTVLRPPAPPVQNARISLLHSFNRVGQ